MPVASAAKRRIEVDPRISSWGCPAEIRTRTLRCRAGLYVGPGPPPPKKKTVRLLAIAVAAQRSRTESFADGEVVAPTLGRGLICEGRLRRGSPLYGRVVRSPWKELRERPVPASTHARGQRAPFAINRSTNTWPKVHVFARFGAEGIRLQAGRRQLPIRSGIEIKVSILPASRARAQ
jgi:hypothetical protein